MVAKRNDIIDPKKPIRVQSLPDKEVTEKIVDAPSVAAKKEQKDDVKRKVEEK